MIFLLNDMSKTLLKNTFIFSIVMFLVLIISDLSFYTTQSITTFVFLYLKIIIASFIAVVLIRSKREQSSNNR